MNKIYENYISRCESVLSANDNEEAKTLVKEIVSVFSGTVDQLKAGLDTYTRRPAILCGSQPVPSYTPDYLGDIVKLKGKLEIEAAKQGIEDRRDSEVEENTEKLDKPYKIFISHAGKDKAYAEKLVELLEDIGLDENEVFCSSVEGYNIPLDENIYDYLLKQFREYNLHVIFVLSDNYYTRPACLNEMGAAWVLKQRYTSILLPGFDPEEIDGVVDPRKMALILDSDESLLDQRLGELMDIVTAEFGKESLKRTRWERIRNIFKNSIKEIKSAEEENTDSELTGGAENKTEQSATHTVRLSRDATVFLAYAGTDPQGQVMVSQTLGSSSVSAGKWNFVRDGGNREFARWTEVVEELERYGLLRATSYKRQVFTLTNDGYKYSDKARELIDTDKSPDEYLRDDEPDKE